MVILLASTADSSFDWAQRRNIITDIVVARMLQNGNWMKYFSRMETILSSEGLNTIDKSAWQWFSSRKCSHWPYKIFSWTEEEDRTWCEVSMGNVWSSMGAKFSEEKQDDIATMHALCALMHALCARRVPGHSFPRHASNAGLPVKYWVWLNIIMLLAGLLGFLCDSQTHPLCVRESNGNVVPGQI